MMLKIVAGATLLALAACSTVALQPSSIRVAATALPLPTSSQADSAINTLLIYQSGLRLRSPAELGAELIALDQAPYSARVKLRQAMLLATLKGEGDLSRAQTILDNLVQSDAADAPALRLFIQFLSASYADMRREDEAQERLSQQLRDAQRRYDQLNDKLEALKNIERTLSVRPQPAS